MKTAFVFPGQGSQYVGMGKALYDAEPEARRLFDDAAAVLDLDIKALCFDGPEDVLTATENVQPAVTLVSIACLHAVRASGLECAAAAGHSLGEYAALYAAGAMSFEYVLKTVRLRGELMRDASAASPGGMLAVMGLDPARYEEVCTDAAAAGVVEVANLNSPGQVILTGENAALERAAVLAKEAGAVYSTPLKVSGPWHSRFMLPAAEELAKHFELSCLGRLRVPVLSNVTGDFYANVAEVREGLVKQVASPVRWVDCVRRLIEEGTELIVEIGPGNMLTRLIRDIDRSVRVASVDAPEGLASLREIIAGGAG